MNTNNNNNLQSAVYGNQINSAIVATRQAEQPNNGSGSNNVNNSNNLANPVGQNNPANQPYLRGSEQNSNSPKAIEQSQTHNNIRHSIDQNNNSHNSSNGNNNNASGQKAIGNGNLFDQTNSSNKQAQVQPQPQPEPQPQPQIQAQDSLKPIESGNSNHKDTNSTVLADATNQKSTSLPLEKLLDKNSLESPDNNANGNDFSTIEHTAKDSEESLNASKKARKPKNTTSSNPSKSETEQSTISFSISTKEKKQIEAVATLLDYESSDDFLKELISQGLKKYLDATTQALKTA